MRSETDLRRRQVSVIIRKNAFSDRHLSNQDLILFNKTHRHKYILMCQVQLCSA